MANKETSARSLDNVKFWNTDLSVNIHLSREKTKQTNEQCNIKTIDHLTAARKRETIEIAKNCKIALLTFDYNIFGFVAIFNAD